MQKLDPHPPLVSLTVFVFTTNTLPLEKGNSLDSKLGSAQVFLALFPRWCFERRYQDGQTTGTKKIAKPSDFCISEMDNGKRRKKLLKLSEHRTANSAFSSNSRKSRIAHFLTSNFTSFRPYVQSPGSLRCLWLPPQSVTSQNSRMLVVPPQYYCSQKTPPPVNVPFPLPPASCCWVWKHVAHKLPAKLVNISLFAISDLAMKFPPIKQRYKSSFPCVFIQWHFRCEYHQRRKCLSTD